MTGDNIDKNEERKKNESNEQKRRRKYNIIWIYVTIRIVWRCVHSKHFSSSDFPTRKKKIRVHTQREKHKWIENERNERTFLETTNNKIQDASIMASIYLSIYTSICLSIHLSDSVKCILCVVWIQSVKSGWASLQHTTLLFVCVHSAHIQTHTHTLPKTRANFQHPMLSSHVYMKSKDSVSKFYTNTKVWTHLLNPQR